MDNTLQQLAHYVYQQLQQGVSEQNIRAALAQNRWTEDWIDAVFNVVHQNPNMFKAPSIQPLQRSPAFRPISAPSTEADRPASSIEAAPPEDAAPTRSIPQKRRKHLGLAIVVAVVLLGLAAGAYFVFQPGRAKQPAATSTPAPTQETPKQAKTPDETRKDDLNTLLSDLADFYVAHSFYPTYETLKSKEFADQNPTFDTTAFADPKWSEANAACTENGKAIMAARPALSCYTYGAVTSEGAACDNIKLFCTRFTVAAMLDNGNPYPITLDRNTQADN